MTNVLTIAIKTDERERLIRFIKAHGMQAVSGSNGTILALSLFTYMHPVSDEVLVSEGWQEISPTMSAVRNWLGY